MKILNSLLIALTIFGSSTTLAIDILGKGVQKEEPMLVAGAITAAQLARLGIDFLVNCVTETPGSIEILGDIEEDRSILEAMNSGHQSEILEDLQEDSSIIALNRDVQDPSLDKTLRWKKKKAEYRANKKLRTNEMNKTIVQNYKKEQESKEKTRQPIKIEKTDGAKKDLKELKNDPNRQHVLTAVNKTIEFMETNLRHGSLQAHEYHNMLGPKNERVFESYVQNKTPRAYRIFWCYEQDNENTILILAITNHP
jgi:hypothetical protein